VWSDDDELGGWSSFMGEGKSGKTNALKKGKQKRELSARAKEARGETTATVVETHDDAGPIAEKPAKPAKTAYKRGGLRPWEVARAARDAAAAAAAEAPLAKRLEAAPEPSNAFARAGLPSHMCGAMEKAGLKRTTEIQRLAIPELSRGEDVVLLAETGSGKTFAYVLPAVAAIGAPGRGGTKVQGRCCPSMIILVPNVELGRQVAYMAELAAEWVETDEFPRPGVFSLLGKDKKLLKPTTPKARGAAKTAAIKRKVQEKAAVRAARAAAREAAERAAAGEGASEEEIAEVGNAAADDAGSRASNEIRRAATTGHAIKAGAKGSKMSGDMEVIPEFRRAEILVATPARLLSMMRDGWVMPGRIKHVVVDEADEMLSRGFENEVAGVIRAAYQDDGVNRFGAKVQFCFAAATMREEGPILGALEERMEKMKWISSSGFGDTHPQLQQRVRDVRGDDERKDALVDALTDEKQHQAVVFVSDPAEAEDVVKHLSELDFVAMSFHGKTSDRGVALDEFFDGHLPVLVCTDLAARGIDFPSLHHVIQYTPAATAEMHLHRCGRTARTGSEGPFIVTCLVDREADEVDDEVAKLMGLDVRGGGGGGGGREDAGGDPR
jgi:protein transport protein SEC31